jgi:hypothetical protein
MSTLLVGLANIAGVFTWPIVTLIVLLAYRRNIAGLIGALGGRVTKLSVFKVELELATSESSAPSVVLNQLRDTTQAAVADSAGALFTQLQDSTPADFAIIDLGRGDEWITSRLFIAAALLERMRGLRAMVFVESRQWLPGYFLAVASPSVVRWSLARRYPWLELAYATATEKAIAVTFPPPYFTPIPGTATAKDLASEETIVTSDWGTLDGRRAEVFTREFLSSIQYFTGTPTPPTSQGWVDLNGYRERAAWLTSQLLRELLPAAVFDLQMNEMRDEPQVRRARAVLRRPGDFVALVDADQRFKRLVDRRMLLEEAAQQLSQETG